MLFDYFHKNVEEEFAREHFGGFQDGYTPQQKKAIMLSLYLIAISDQDLDVKEMQFFEQTSRILGYRLSDDFMEVFKEIKPEELFTILNSLDESQKDWYIITSYGMLQADNKILESESDYLMYLYNNMGITEERFESVVRKAEALRKYFKL